MVDRARLSVWRVFETATLSFCVDRLYHNYSYDTNTQHNEFFYGKCLNLQFKTARADTDTAHTAFTYDHDAEDTLNDSDCDLPNSHTKVSLNDFLCDGRLPRRTRTRNRFGVRGYVTDDSVESRQDGGQRLPDSEGFFYVFMATCGDTF